VRDDANTRVPPVRPLEDAEPAFIDVRGDDLGLGKRGGELARLRPLSRAGIDHELGCEVCGRGDREARGRILDPEVVAALQKRPEIRVGSRVHMTAGLLVIAKGRR
jgi:hypothetical protein